MPQRFLSLMILAVIGFVSPGQAQDESGGEKEGPSNLAEKIARDIEAKVARVRGLEFRSPTKIGVYEKDELRRFLEKEIKAEADNDQEAARSRALQLLGLLPTGTDLQKMQLDLLEEQVAGFYDPRRKQLFLIKVAADDQAGNKLNEVIMSHELVHALQDQHFNLEDIGLEGEDDDRTLAVTSLIEGDATFAMMFFTDERVSPSMVIASAAFMPTDSRGLRRLADQLKASGQDLGADLGLGPGMGMESLESTPAIMMDPMIFGYYGGLKFVTALYRDAGDKGYKAIDHAFRSPPLSSEQILHPEKYLSEKPDWPSRVQLPDLAETLGEGWTKSFENTLGEMRLRTLLNESRIRRARRIHGGWDGDRYALYEREGSNPCLVWHSVWDSEEDAREYAEAIANVIGAERETRPELAQEGGLLAAWAGEGESLRAIALDGTRCTLIFDAPKTALAPLVDRIGKESKIEEQTPLKRRLPGESDEDN